jgi:hypothetical protein
MTEREIKKQGPFDASLESCVPDAERREEIERAIRYAVRYFAEQGEFTGRSAPFPVYALSIERTARNSAHVVFYCFSEVSVLLLRVRETQQ